MLTSALVLGAWWAVVAAARIGMAVEAATAPTTLVPVPAEIVALDRVAGVDLETVVVDLAGYAPREVEVLAPDTGPGVLGEVVLVRGTDEASDLLDFVSAPFAVDRTAGTDTERLDGLARYASRLHYGGILVGVVATFGFIGALDEVLRRGAGRWRPRS